jgi:alkanesulfonate monooxygenase SsuD/methylene tetrahydromethanopterin reductase-like flavin-dependent oxidoreductase (luciferase family)
MARTALFYPNFGPLADPRVLVGLSVEAEAAGWDGVFLWDHVQYRAPTTDVGDPWTSLAAMALATEKIVLGPMVTPLARRRPQIVARQSTTIDQISDGRFVLGVGLGLDASGAELSSFGEEVDDKRRAVMFDEALDLVQALWTGERVDHDGEHYKALDVRFLPKPVQQPSIPIWAAARYPYKKPVRRAARLQGLFPIDLEHPDQLAEMLDLVKAERGSLDGYDVICQGWDGDDPAPWIAAGATWWLIRFDFATIDLDLARHALRNRPSV